MSTSTEIDSPVGIVSGRVTDTAGPSRTTSTGSDDALARAHRHVAARVVDGERRLGEEGERQEAVDVVELGRQGHVDEADLDLVRLELAEAEGRGRRQLERRPPGRTCASP